MHAYIVQYKYFSQRLEIYKIKTIWSCMASYLPIQESHYTMY